MQMATMTITALLKDPEHENGYEGGGEGEKGVGQTHRYRIQKPTVISSQQAHSNTEGAGNENNPEAHSKGGSASVEDGAENSPPLIIGSQEECGIASFHPDGGL